MKLLEKYILIEQTAISKKIDLLLPVTAKDDDRFDYSFKVLQKGPQCDPIIEVGDKPIFTNHVRFLGIKVISKTDNKMIVHVIVHETDIVGFDNEQE